MADTMEAPERPQHFRTIKRQQARQRTLLQAFPDNARKEEGDTTGLDCLTMVIRAIYARLDTADRNEDEPIDEDGSETIRQQEARLDILRYCFEVANPAGRNKPLIGGWKMRAELVAKMDIRGATFSELMEHRDVKAVFRRREHRLIEGTFETPLDAPPEEQASWGATLKVQNCHDLSFPVLDCAELPGVSISDFVNDLFRCYRNPHRGAKIQLVPTPPDFIRLKVVMGDQFAHEILTARSFVLTMEMFGVGLFQIHPRYHLIAVVLLANDKHTDKVRTYDEIGLDVKPTEPRRYNTEDWVLGSPGESYVLFYVEDRKRRPDQTIPDFVKERDEEAVSRDDDELTDHLRAICRGPAQDQRAPPSNQSRFPGGDPPSGPRADRGRDWQGSHPDSFWWPGDRWGGVSGHKQDNGPHYQRHGHTPRHGHSYNDDRAHRRNDGDRYDDDRRRGPSEDHDRHYRR